MVLHLSKGDSSVAVSPDHGASLLAFTAQGVPVLRPGHDSPDPRTLACFPLVPYCNRIDHGIFHWDGRPIEVGPSIVGEPHALHGHGWLSRWDVADQTPDTAILRLVHPAGAFPWRYEAIQFISVSEDRLSLRLELTNRSDDVMPGGLGFHPFFERPARLTATVDGVWVGENVIPERWEERPGFRAVDLDTIVSDHTYTGWDGRAILDTGRGKIEIVSDLDRLHLYSPPGRGFVAIEPVTAAADAFNHPDRGLLTIEPGETIGAEMTITRVG